MATEFGGETRVLVADFDVVGVVLLLAVDVAESENNVGQVTLTTISRQIQCSVQPVAAAVTQIGPGCQQGLNVTSGVWWGVNVVIEGDDIGISVSGKIPAVTARAWEMQLINNINIGLYTSR